MNLATQSQEDRKAAIIQCRDLEGRCLRIGHKVGADWANKWANGLLDSRVPANFYRAWIGQLASFVERREAQMERVAA